MGTPAKKVAVITATTFVLLSAQLSHAQEPVAPESAAAVELDDFVDANDDVRFDPFGNGDGDTIKGDHDGDVRRVRAGVGKRRVVVRVRFDASDAYAGADEERLDLSVTFAAPDDDSWGYVALLDGDFSDAQPDLVLYKFKPGPYNPHTVACPGFATWVEVGVWSFSVPKRCLRPRRFTAKRIVVRTLYFYDDGEARDRFPRRGTRRIS